MKKTLAVFLCFCFLFAAALPAFSATGETRLYNVYADGMLFQRNTDAILAGKAPGGSAILAELIDAGGKTVAAGKAVATRGNTFAVSFPAPAGGYASYTVRVSCNGGVFAELKNVVFGELWLASGQSNMQYALGQTEEGKAMAAAGETGPKAVRVLLVPPPYANGAYQTRYLPQTDAISCAWISCDDSRVFEVSAVAYYFAVRLQERLDMPVGILNVAVGGSCIAPWLSRAAIDGDETVRGYLTETGGYYEAARWTDPDRSILTDMTNLYNTNISPLTNFRPQGAVWYQGCSDLMYGRSNAYYQACFRLMQESYTEVFGYTRGTMPFIFTQLACYDYGRGPVSVTRFNEAFTALAKVPGAARGMVTIYDLPLDYNEMGYIHPMTKQPIGERMFLLAESLVYGKKSPSSAPACVKSEAKDGSVYLTFDHVGSGLQFTGKTPCGFAVCGKDGICVEADAEIVSNNTVRVFSKYVPEPVAATYAAGNWSQRANLWSFYGGKPYLPAAPHGIADPAIKHPFADNAWMNCEDLTAFDSGCNDEYTDAWETSGCEIAVDTESPAEGGGALRVTAKLPLFMLSPKISAKKDLKTDVFDNADADWSDYTFLRMQVKNRGKADVRLNQIRLYTGEAAYYTPVCAESGITGVTVPADGEWHAVTFRLDRLLSMGVGSREYTNEKLSGIKRIRFCWEGADAELLLDDIRVLPASADLPGENEKPSGILAYLKALFTSLFDRIKAFFAGLFTR